MLWKPFVAYGILICCVLSVVIGWLLWSKNSKNKLSNRLLAMLLFVNAYIYFVTMLLTDGSIRYIPHLFRTAAPLNYLIGPLIYLYVYVSLFSTNRLSLRRFGWLFVPFVVNVVEFLPFYFHSGAYKVERLRQINASFDSLFTINEGLLPPQFHLVGYTTSSLVYSVLATRLWWLYRQRETAHQHSNPVFRNWLATFVLVHLSVNLIWAIELPFVRTTPMANLSLNITYCLAQLTICLYIIQRPTLLYGAYRSLKPSDGLLPAPPEPVPHPAVEPEPMAQPVFDGSSTNLTKSEWLEAELDIQEKLQLLEQYMHSQQPYLQPRLSVADVSVATHIPPYLLSAMLNRIRGLDFRDYVNEHRVRHLCQLLESNQLTHLTLEGISTQAGFSSKTTFYRAFQKHTGSTPAQYITRRQSTNRA